ncbi:MAG: acetylxylan esterase [Gemmatimonadota bacterium]|nr:acetylxylan esterase [Gemmatimonadota bacterium]
MNSYLTTPIVPSHQVEQDLTSYLLDKITPFQVPEHQAWEAEAERLRVRVLDEVIFKGVPDDWRNGDPKVEWTDVIETGHGYLIRKLRYEALPGLCIPALLYEPDTLDGKVPAVLNVNGHVGPPGKAIDYKQIRCINLAKRGVLALNPEWMKFGELQGAGYNHNNAGYLDLCGIAGVGVFYLAMLRGLDVLLAHQHTDEERVAVTGLSGGGWQTILLSALDTRVRLAVPTAGYIGLDYRVRNRGDIGDIEQNPADLATIADYPMLTAMLAPRPALLLYNQDDDCCFQTHRSKPSVYDPIRPLYEALGLDDAFQFHNNVDPGTHNYDLDNRQQFYRFFNRHFLSDTDIQNDEIPSDNEVLSEEMLMVGLPDHNADFVSLAAVQAKNLPESSFPTGVPDEIEHWQGEARDRLREVLRYPSMAVSEHQTSPMEAQDGYLIQRHQLQMTGGWHIPIVAVSKNDGHEETHIIITDEGRAGAAPHIPSTVGENTCFLAPEILLQGECRPAVFPAHQWAMMASAAGERFLGIQAAQLVALIHWLPEQRITLTGAGPVSGVVTLLAAALAEIPIERIYLYDSLASLTQLFEQPDQYDHMPSLFCFGLLKYFDIKDLIALVAPTSVIVD